MSNNIQLQSRPRSGRGKGPARELRRQQRIPAVLYGKGADPVALDVDAREFQRMISGISTSNTIVDLAVEGGGDLKKTLIREIQVDPLTGEILHIDLNEISLTEMIEIEVPVELEGVAPGVKNSGGILQHSIRALSLKCLPHQIPERIVLDVSRLEVGDAIRVEDLDLTDLEILADPDTTLANVVMPAKVEEPTPEEEEAAAEGAEPEVVGKKEDEEGEDKKEKKEEKD
jgi:large subunit ribosomal protein L25